MGNIGRAVEELVDTVTAVCSHHRAVPLLGELLDDVARLPEKHPGLDNVHCGLKAVTGGFNDPDSRRSGRSDVVGFVEIAVEATVVEGHVNVDDVAILERTSIGNAVADDFVDAGADGFGEVVVVERGGIGLEGRR